MNLGELLRTYAPHIYQAHLEWAENDLCGRDPAEMEMAEPTALRDIDCDIDDDVTGFLASRWREFNALDLARADAFADILSPAEQAAAGLNSPKLPKLAMESSPHGGKIDIIVGKPGCPHRSGGVPCAMCALGIAPQNQYTQIDTTPVYTAEEIEKGKLIGEALDRMTRLGL